MSYSNFTLSDLKKTFQLIIDESQDLFAGTTPVCLGDVLTAALADNVPLALAIHTEKARSELIIAPILVELWKHGHGSISLFSGTDFNVDSSKGLAGTCDFLISRSPQQLFITAPILALVEAKNENIKGGLAQCLAEMIAAQIFNQREGNGIKTVHGAVTTGSIWKFLRLEGNHVWIDKPEYYLDRGEKIMGILQQIVEC